MTQKRIRCDVYSRIVGYISPLKRWHEGKRQEFKDRLEYALPMLDKNGQVLGADEVRRYPTPENDALPEA